MAAGRADRYTVIDGTLGSLGALVDVKLELPGPELERRRVEGQIAPPPVYTKAIIDTGAERSIVVPNVLRDMLLLNPLRYVQMFTVGGETSGARAEVHAVRMTIGPPGDQAGPIDLAIVRAGINHEPSGVGCLLGHDVLSIGALGWDGTQRIFSLVLPS